jgi:hypothetical protein
MMETWRPWQIGKKKGKSSSLLYLLDDIHMYLDGCILVMNVILLLGVESTVPKILLVVWN